MAQARNAASRCAVLARPPIARRSASPPEATSFHRSYPGTADQVRQVRDDLRDWTLGKVIWVADRGFTSKENRRDLSAGGDGYILGEKLRSGSAEAQSDVSP